ncbi:Lrp/AsnC family transcriptional regulator [Hahella sp. CR1]|uniref:Lrp/AsnC family transcriptional regulator n=1 Tax=Hahella sp. CR1 TaxID=2992807 RepID=UPI0024434C5D|nr:Lrp/AsnC family transcriptional regulator [Hahella sp. CR1]MDG9668629.1 Lrp/AsnC family transcriptional regulator [Hahella sp. CR1]
MSLDRIDKKILSLLQNDCSQTNLDLAESVGLSPPACLKRVKKLREEGYIQKQVAILDPDAFGACLHMVVEVVMERDRLDLYQQFLKRATAAKEVKQCYQVTGEVDFVLVVTVPNMTAYDKFCNEVLYAEPNMRKFRTLISMQRHKFDTTLNLDAIPS